MDIVDDIASFIEQLVSLDIPRADKVTLAEMAGTLYRKAYLAGYKEGMQED